MISSKQAIFYFEMHFKRTINAIGPQIDPKIIEIIMSETAIEENCVRFP